MGEEKRVKGWRGWHLLERLIYDYCLSGQEVSQDALTSRDFKQATLAVRHPKQFLLDLTNDRCNHKNSV